jgi:hypothetical protein
MLSFLIEHAIFVAHKLNVRPIHICSNKVLIHRSPAVPNDSAPVSHTIDSDNHRERWYQLVLE